MIDYENDLSNINEDEMSSSIDKLKKNNEKIDINSFILDLENNLDNIDNRTLENNKDNVDKVNEYQHLENNNANEYQHLENNKVKSKEIKVNKEDDNYSINKYIYTFLINIKEPLIIILLFILLNNKDLVILIDKIPYIDIVPDNFLSLLLRGVILAIIIYYFKKFDN